LIFYFEEPDDPDLLPELFEAEPLFALAPLFEPEAEALPVDFCALAADADLVLPDLLPPLVVLAAGVLDASFAPAVFLGAADFEAELPLLPLDEPLEAPEDLLDELPELFAAPDLDDEPDFDPDEPELFAAEPELFAAEPELFAAEPELLDAVPDDFEDEPELFPEPADDFAEEDFPELEELLAPPDEPPVLLVAADFADPFPPEPEPDLEDFPPDVEPETVSIAETAAPVTAPAAAPASTSPIASLALS